jgi:hypothetical protein
MERTTKASARFLSPGGIIFTLFITGLMLTAAIVSGSLYKPLTPAWQDQLGFAPRDLFTPRWDRMFTSALVTSGGKGFWPAFGAMIALVLTSEKLSGSRRAALAFWIPHLGASIGGSLLTWLAVQFSKSTLLNEIYTLRDVGPSAGYFGCMGLIVAQLPRPWKYLAGFGIMAGLIGGMIYSAHYGPTIDVSAGLAHLVAFPLGWSITYIPFLKRPRA